MFATDILTAYALPICFAQVVGITAPAIYASLTFGYSHHVMLPIAEHAPPKILAKLWLDAYQVGPRFVPLTIIPGVISNALLAYLAASPRCRLLYAGAALLTWSIVPITVLYFEPNINGAGKWKVQQLLADESFSMKENEKRVPWVDRHTGSPAARKWAESVTMNELVREWARLNRGRYFITALAALLSAIATCSWK